jgi:hypothetical protein
MTMRSEFSSETLRGTGCRYEPRQSLEGKQNFSRHVFIERDGSIKEVVRLNVLDDRHREEIVAYHFARQYAEIHYRGPSEEPQFYVVGRDCPWDFEYVMHDASTFYLEICRIADRRLLKAIKAENDFSVLMAKGELRGYEILKVEKGFPGTIPQSTLDQIKTKLDRQKLFRFEDDNQGPRLFMRPMMDPRLDLKAEIKQAIEKKVAKRHAGKERTILLIDNITTHSDPAAFFEAFSALEGFIEEVPFPSIWLYTGYYSDHNGFDCEFSLTPIKLTDVEWEALSRSNEDGSSEA